MPDERFELKNADKLRGALVPEKRSGSVRAIYLVAAPPPAHNS